MIICQFWHNDILYWSCMSCVYCYVSINYSILFYSILFYSILFYSILFYSILFYSILFYSILFYSILFYSILQGISPYRKCAQKKLPCRMCAPKRRARLQHVCTTWNGSTVAYVAPWGIYPLSHVYITRKAALSHVCTTWNNSPVACVHHME